MEKNITKKETQMEFCERRRSHFVQHHRALILVPECENEENKRPSSSYAKLTRAEIARSIVFTDLKREDVSEKALLLLVAGWCRRTYKLVDSVVSRAILKKSGGVVVVLRTRAAAIALSSARFQLSASGTATLASDLLCSSTAYASAVSKARSTTYSAVPQALTRLIAAALDRARREKSVRASAEKGRLLLTSLMKGVASNVNISPPAPIPKSGRLRDVFDRASGVFAGIGDGLYSRVAEELLSYYDDYDDDEDEGVEGDFV